MRNNILIVIIVIIMFGLVGAGYSIAAPKTQKMKVNDCTSGSMVDIQNCLDAKIKEASNKLDFVYKFIYHNKIADGPEKEMFREQQQAWQASMDSGVAFLKEKESNAGSYGNIVIQRYIIFMIQDRVKELKFLGSTPEDDLKDL